MSSRLAWSTRASSRSGSKATEKPCLEKTKTKQIRDSWELKSKSRSFVWSRLQLCYKYSSTIGNTARGSLSRQREYTQTVIFSTNAQKSPYFLLEIRELQRVNSCNQGVCVPGAQDSSTWVIVTIQSKCQLLPSQ